MNAQILQARLERLKAEREQARLTMIAYDGAIQECEYWLAHVTAPDVQNVFPGAEIVPDEGRD